MRNGNLKKRLFLGWEVSSPWPERFPPGRVLAPQDRHFTLAFLGNIEYESLLEAMTSFPLPPFKVGCAAKFNQCLFYPAKEPRVAAWGIEWMEKGEEMKKYAETIFYWLEQKGVLIAKSHGFSPHVTLARAPFNKKEWQKAFCPLPCYLQKIHLYESLGMSRYTSRWSMSLLTAFEEMEHTADIAFRIRGESYEELYHHAFSALAFEFPPLLNYFVKPEKIASLNEVIISLNQSISFADAEIGAPFKAVSFHQNLKEEQTILAWEMIIDV